MSHQRMVLGNGWDSKATAVPAVAFTGPPSPMVARSGSNSTPTPGRVCARPSAYIRQDGLSGIREQKQVAAQVCATGVLAAPFLAHLAIGTAMSAFRVLERPAAVPARRPRCAVGGTSLSASTSQRTISEARGDAGGSRSEPSGWAGLRGGCLVRGGPSTAHRACFSSPRSVGCDDRVYCWLGPGVAWSERRWLDGGLALRTKRRKCFVPCVRVEPGRAGRTIRRGHRRVTRATMA